MSNNNDDGSVDDETINEEDDDDEAEQEKWYWKAKFMLDWVNRFSQTHCVHPGFAISIDEMMKLFKGRSNMTHRMKKKPIKQGFKFYAMVCALSGYCFFFFPDGLKEKKKRGIADAVVFMVRHLPDRKKKQYVVVMDNYFTLVKTMIGTRKCGVAVMGTARGRYVLDCVCVCMCVCVLSTWELKLRFYSCLEPTGHQQNLATLPYTMRDTIHCIT